MNRICRMQHRLSALFFCAVMLTGCAKSAQTAILTEETETDTNAARGKQSGQLGEQEQHETLTICAEGMDYTCFLDALHEKYPDINLTFVSCENDKTNGYGTDAIKNGDIPDIYTCNCRPDAALQENYLLNLGNYEFINNYSDTVLEEVDADGGVYMIPSSYRISGICYNKTMFLEHGWKVPESFEELTALTAQIREEEPSVTPVAADMGGRGNALLYMLALGSTDFLGTSAGARWKQQFLEGSASAAGNLEGTADYFKEWVDAGYVTVGDSDPSDVLSDFYDGKIAMLLCNGIPAWSGTGETTGETVAVGVMAWPGEGGNHGMILCSAWRYYGISRALAEPGNEKKLTDACRVLEFISTAEGQEALCQGSKECVLYPFGNFSADGEEALGEVKEYIEQGYTVSLACAGWEDALLLPMEDEILRLVRGEIGTDDMLAEFDRINKQLHE